MLLLLAWLLAGTPAAASPAVETALSVPFLPQTEDLCGGAAAAMVFRFFGDRHADVQQFAPIVDRRAGGISTTALTAAIRARGWNAARVDGSVPALRERIARGEPVILLIEDRPSRYHFVVAIQADESGVVVHDPARGPSRRYAIDALLRAWARADFWALSVTPGSATAGTAAARAAAPVTTAAPADPTRCERLFEAAMDDIAAQSQEPADEVLGRVGQTCPGLAAVPREVAGIRFGQRRWHEAEGLAAKAVALDPADRYAWDVLGSSRFMQNDTRGALDAWNHLDRPVIDRIDIRGVHRTRYSALAEYVGLVPNSRLTADAFRMAERRVSDLPDRQASRLSYTLDADGFAVLDLALVEQPFVPSGRAEWTARGAAAAINREVAVALPGATGQGETWSLGWRWWNDRPRVALGFASPAPRAIGGVWRADLAWETQTYSTSCRCPANTISLEETRTTGSIGLSRWLTPSLRLTASAGVDSSPATATHGQVIVGIEQRYFDDRLALAANGTRAIDIGNGVPFSKISFAATARTSSAARGLVVIAHAQADVAGRAAPLAYWEGAGEGHARRGLLRGHPLLVDGAVSGPVFGRRVAVANVEMQRWFERLPMLPVGAALFVDAAGASGRLPGAIGEPFQVDAGIGARVKVPGQAGQFRIDYARGLRDGRSALTVGISVW